MEPQVKIISDKATQDMSGGLSRRQRMRMADEGRFPKPVRLTAGSADRPGRLGWVEGEVLKWNEDRVAERDAGTKRVNGAVVPTHQAPARKVRAQRAQTGNAGNAREKKLLLRVDEIGLPPRVLRTLGSDGITTLGELMRLSEHELLHMPNIGTGAIAQVKKVLAQHRLRLDTEIAAPEAGEKNFDEESRTAGRRDRL
jgi:predicted DNA-binding transcriptional regulator AlpA